MDYFSSTSSASSLPNNINGKTKKKSGYKRGGGNNCGVKLSTDPQSVAARERRHRISDRFKILQSLVPGGSKMDTVSMLEEAINYVKFLKTQIMLHQSLMNIANDDESNFNNYLPNPDSDHTALVSTAQQHQFSLLDGNFVGEMQPGSVSVSVPFHESCFETEEAAMYCDPFHKN